jgi:hypothetical protein
MVFLNSYLIWFETFNGLSLYTTYTIYLLLWFFFSLIYFCCGCERPTYELFNFEKHSVFEIIVARIEAFCWYFDMNVICNIKVERNECNLTTNTSIRRYLYSMRYLWLFFFWKVQFKNTSRQYSEGHNRNVIQKTGQFLSISIINQELALNLSF